LSFPFLEKKWRKHQGNEPPPERRKAFLPGGKLLKYYPFSLEMSTVCVESCSGGLG